jgi:hypothetical protein
MFKFPIYNDLYYDNDRDVVELQNKKDFREFLRRKKKKGKLSRRDIKKGN